jgi:heme oxygenase
LSARTLTSRLKDATRELHRDAENAGGMSALLRGHVDRAQYCLLLRNLHALYEALEAALDRHAALALVAPVRVPGLYRTAALAADLRALHGAGWIELPVAAAMRSYVARLEEIARTQPPLLAAHAYVRYMGDLSGGQILRDVVRRALDLQDGAGMAFYTFAGGEDGRVIKERYRAALDALPVDDALAQEIVVEARDAFARHVELFEELHRPPA